MPDEVRMNRPPSVGRPETMYSQEMHAPRGRSRMPWIILAVVVVVIVVLGILFRDKLFGSSQTSSGKTSGYQAVFLTNGQVYFGKLSGVGGQYATLTDIYYLQVTQPPLQGSQSATGTNANTNTQTSTQQPQLSLVKLGNELHGPLDSMQINRDQILFYEDMKEDGKVMEAIRQYQKNPPSNTQSNTQQQTPVSNTPTNQ